MGGEVGLLLARSQVLGNEAYENRNGFLLYLYKSKKQSVKIKFLCNIAQRWKQHCKCGLGIDASATNKLYNAMQEHGVCNFTFELIEECPRNLLNEKEKFWIEAFESNKYGHYNSTGGNK